MVGEGYDFAPITIVVPMRPYVSFSEFYQFVGRGIRILLHPALIGRVGPGEQFLDVIFHAELGLDDHVHTIYLENDMDPSSWDVDAEMGDNANDATAERGGSSGRETAS